MALPRVLAGRERPTRPRVGRIRAGLDPSPRIAWRRNKAAESPDDWFWAASRHDGEGNNSLGRGGITSG